MSSYKDFFDWTFGPFAFAGSTYWKIVTFSDGTEWFRLGLGLYIRTE